MKFRKTKTSPPTNRQRILGERQSTPTAFSYHSRRSEQELNTGRQLFRASTLSARRFGKFWFQRFGLFILLCAAVVCLVSALTLSSDPKVVLVAGSSQQPFLQEQQVYVVAAATALRSSIWNRNKITVNTERINRQLTAQFPELAGVSTTLPLLSHRPVIYLEAARPAVILHASSGSYVLDTTGKALLSEAIPSEVQALNLPVVTDQSSLPIRLNHEVLRASDITFIQTVVAELRAHDFTPSSLILPPESNQLDVHFEGQPYYIKFNLQLNDARQQVGTFLAVASKLTADRSQPSSYVDVRVKGRAYYK